MNDHIETNTDLMRRLGIEIRGVRRLSLFMEIGKAPVMTVERYVLRDDEVDYRAPTVFESFVWSRIEGNA